MKVFKITTFSSTYTCESIGHLVSEETLSDFHSILIWELRCNTGCHIFSKRFDQEHPHFVEGRYLYLVLVGALVWLLLVLLKSVVQLSLLLVVMAVARLGENL